MVNALENRAIAAEATSSRLDSTVEGLRVKLDQVTSELIDRTKELATRSESLSGTEAKERTEADRTIEDLERKNAQLIKAAIEIVARYRDGLLVSVFTILRYLFTISLAT